MTRVGGERISQSTEDSQGNETSLYDIIMMGMSFILAYLSKATECIIPRVNPNVNYGLGVIMCQCQLHLGKQYNIKLSVFMGEAMDVCVCEGDIWKSLYLPLSFVVNLKLP